MMPKNPGFYKVLLEAIPAPVFYKDAKGVYIDCNKAFLKFLCKKRKDVIGKSVYDMAPKKIADTYFKKDKELFDNPGTQVYEWKVTDKKGNIKQVIFHKATFTDQKGKVAGIIGVILDITQRKLAEEALRKSESELKEKNAELQQFNKMAVGRELKMVELKNKIRDLEKQLSCK